MNSSFALHPEAFGELDEIRNFLAQQNPDTADLVISEIFDTVRSVLVPFPNSGHRRPDLTSRPSRFFVAMHQYLIVYAPNEMPLWIVAVMDGRRSPRITAAILKGIE